MSGRTKCRCGHSAEHHHATCLPPFDEGQQCHHRVAPLPCLGNHCEWMNCSCHGTEMSGAFAISDKTVGETTT